MLDTNAASMLIREKATAMLQALVAEHPLCFSVITEAELRFGVARRPEATRLAKTVDVFLADTPVLPWTPATAEACGERRARMETLGVSVAAVDLLVAAHAAVDGCIIVSADRAFSRVPGLKTLNWS